MMRQTNKPHPLAIKSVSITSYWLDKNSIHCDLDYQPKPHQPAKRPVSRRAADGLPERYDSYLIDPASW